MIVSEAVGDLFQSTQQTLVCPVNVVGVMGKGLAKVFDQRYPGLLPYYKRCYTHEVDLDRERHEHLFLYPGKSHRVLLFPTKFHWRHPSRLEWIDANLQQLAQTYETLGITSLAIPMIGCGEGLLTWAEVQPLIHQHLDPIALPVEIVLSPHMPM